MEIVRHVTAHEAVYGIAKEDAVQASASQGRVIGVVVHTLSKGPVGIITDGLKLREYVPETQCTADAVRWMYAAMAKASCPGDLFAQADAD